MCESGFTNSSNCTHTGSLSVPLKRWQNWALWPLWRIWDLLKPEKSLCQILHRWVVHVCMQNFLLARLSCFYSLECIFLIVSLGWAYGYFTATNQPSCTQTCFHHGPCHSGSHSPNFIQRHAGIPYSSGAGTMEGRAGGSVWRWGKTKWMVVDLGPRVCIKCELKC